MGQTNTDVNVYLTNQELTKKTEKNVINATLGTNWIGTAAPYTQSIAVDKIQTTSNPQITVDFSTTTETALTEIEEWGKVSYAKTGNGTITFTCLEEKPTVSFNLVILLIQ